MTTMLGIPKLRHSFTEAVRASLELCAFQASRAILSAATPQGDGAPVLVLPGFGAGDATTAVLRGFLQDKGYYAHALKGGRNIGPSQDALAQMRDRLDEVFKKHGGRKVTLIGHSLGGVFARELARAYPDKVEQVITLGAPFGASEKSEISVRALLKLFHILYGGKLNFTGNQSITDHLLDPLPVPSTSIYSQMDGVVNWRSCINLPGQKNADHAEVMSSHCGLVMNPLSMLVVLDRLQQKPGEWKPFNRKDYSGFLFPSDQGHETYTPPNRPKRSHLPGPYIFD